MKINDLGILSEGPLDALKQFGRAIVDPTDKSGKQEFYKYKTSMQTQFQRWANQTGAGKPDLKNEELICQWLTDQYGLSQKELAEIGLNCAAAKPGAEKPAGPKGQEEPGKTPPTEEPKGQAGPGPTPGGETPAGEEPKPGETPAGEEPKAGETPKAGEEPKAEEKPGQFDFKDPAKFKAEYDKYVAAQNAKNKSNGMGPFQLGSEPQLLSVLKQMWMQTGGTKAESTTNKGPILNEFKKILAAKK